MGLFLSLSGIIGKTPEESLAALQAYAISKGGNLKRVTSEIEDDKRCVVAGENNNTTIIYPPDHLDRDESSAFLSSELHAPVFSFHIHDGDFWMFTLYRDGKIITQFNPIPDYWDWDDDIPSKALAAWQGDAATVCKHVLYLRPENIERYFQRWNLEDENPGKAYENDEYNFGDEWQLIDFMNKLWLPYPIQENVNFEKQYFEF